MTNDRDVKEWLLCYVDGEEPFAYFSNDPDHVQIEGWSKAPWQHNTHIERDQPAGVEVLKVAFDGPWRRSGVSFAPISVKEIAAGAYCWLSTDPLAWPERDRIVAIHHRTPLPKFAQLLQRGGGRLYLAVPDELAAGGFEQWRDQEAPA